MPPYHKVATGVVWVAFQFNHEAVRPFLPDGVLLTESSVGILGIYQAHTGFGLAPYTRGMVGISVNGQPGTDVPEGMLVLADIIDEPGASRLRRLYSGNTFVGSARTWQDGALLRGTASVGDEEWLRATIRPGGDKRRDMCGVDTFLGVTEAGLVAYADSNVSDLEDAEIISVEITDAAPAIMQAMRPTGFVFGLHAARVSSIWSEPRVVGNSAVGDAAQMFLGIVEDAGRAAAIVRQDGTLIATNSSGRQLLGIRARPGEQLLGGTVAERQALGAALRHSVARTGPRVSDPIALARSGGGHLVAYVLPLEHGEHSADAALVLMTDPHGPERRDAGQLLQLFGLTGAEARLAALVGTGVAPRAAAAELSITEHTARSTMKTIYDKLGIRKQSELGHLVARLQHF
ncbi:MAG: hypothetical protein IPK28_21895 [Devosia sp.]|nr:hypothetical protein [Devosia sp.]